MYAYRSKFSRFWGLPTNIVFVSGGIEVSFCHNWSIHQSYVTKIVIYV